MLDFLMNPTFNNNISLGPWFFMLMAIVKMVSIAVGSLLISGLFLLFTAVIYKSAVSAHKYLVNLQFTRPLKAETNKPSGLPQSTPNSKSYQMDLPHLAA
ncbi:MAG: hypothetical protein ACM3NT_03705 [Methylocystaceae bacterium]